MSRGLILIVDDEEEIRQSLAAILTSPEAGYEVKGASSAEEALELLGKYDFDHVLSDIYMEPRDGFYLLSRAREQGFTGSIIMMSGKADAAMALDAMDRGATDYIHKPISAGQLFFVLHKAERELRLKRENEMLRAEVEQRYSFANIVAKSQEMLKIFNVIKKIADYKTTVLVTGESGTGKELIARALHFNSIRKNGPFVAVNCGGIPENLLESELFGHARGAFTDAIRSKKGLFEEADKGTIFLDEIGDLPLPLQVKFLRVLQEEEIRPLGDTRSIHVDVRVVAATSKDLGQEMRLGRFREDLYYRINVLTISLPPLRERKEDIPLLVDHFIGKFNQRLNTSIKGVSPEVMRTFLEYKWPGNVRELENIVERAMVLTEYDTIQVEDLPPALTSGKSIHMLPPPLPEVDENCLSIKECSKALERDLIIKALKRTGGNKTQAAQLLEISLPALLYKIKGYEIDVENLP